MKQPIIATKIFMPPPRLEVVCRPELTARLNEGRQRKLTLVSAPAGFGKTSLVSQWITGSGWPAAWLSLDTGDNDPARFLAYIIAALQTVSILQEDTLSELLGIPQAPSPELIMTFLLNEISAGREHFFLILDDFHVIDSAPVSDALAFLLEHLPQRMHLVILTREDPPLPLARLRARGQLTELRATDLRFSFSETVDFLGRVMGLCLSDAEVAELEDRTEGWIAGLQLAAASMRGQGDASDFIRAFTGSNRFILDYLVEEVLKHQPVSVQSFLLRTSILDRMCGPLCDAVVRDNTVSGQEILEELERSNLFIVPLDAERRWYRYHHLFASLLRQQLAWDVAVGNKEGDANECHLRASRWYETNGLALEAFRHAVAANNVECAERLIEGNRIPMRFGGAAEVLAWLNSLPDAVLDARPLLRVRSATLLLVTGQSTGVEDRLLAAEAALAAFPQNADTDGKICDLFGQIAAARGTLAFTRYQPDEMVTQSRRALECLARDNMPFRFTANWTLGMACLFRGERAEAGPAITGALSLAKTSKDPFNTILALTSLGQIQLLENRLDLAEVTFKDILQMIGDRPHQISCEAYRGLAYINYERNDLDTAERYGQLSLERARLYDRVIDRYVLSEVLLARVKQARGDIAGAVAMLEETGQTVRRNNFVHRISEVAAAQVEVLLRQNNPGAAGSLAQRQKLPMSLAKVYLYEGNAEAALAVLEPVYGELVRKDWQDELLRVLALQAVAVHVAGDTAKACLLLDQALMMAEPGGFIRVFVDEGARMYRLLTDMTVRSVLPGYVDKIMTAFKNESRSGRDEPGLAASPPARTDMDYLSPRELEVLRLIARGLSNQEICKHLFLALDTVKGHNRRIFEKLQVQRRTEAVARARELGLI